MTKPTEQQIDVFMVLLPFLRQQCEDWLEETGPVSGFAQGQWTLVREATSTWPAIVALSEALDIIEGLVRERHEVRA